jgi:2-hydroxy-3-keto-5-methylthiopentenyl-1-phosphate phosphatase
MHIMRPDTRGIFVTDFDGTVARQDFYQLVLARLLPRNVRNYWQDYLAGRITHFEVLRNYFGLIRQKEADVLKLLDEMELDPEFPDAVGRLRAAGWEVVIASAGCSWYIDRLLSDLEDGPVVHANPGRFVPGQGLVMELPHGSSFFSAVNGIDKAAVVKAAQAQVGTDRVAYAGDGPTDIVPSLLVPGHLRFARSELAKVLREKQQPFHPFDRWSDAAKKLLANTP